MPELATLEVFRTLTYGKDQKPVRIARVDDDGTVWFVAQDVCDVLGIVNVTRTTDSLDDDEKGLHSMKTLGGQQKMAVISESGLYSLVLRSRKPEAKPFRRWVTHEVLPSIRKEGQYVRPGSVPAAQPSAWLLSYPEVDTLKARFQAVAKQLGVKAPPLWTEARHTIGFKSYTIPLALVPEILAWLASKTQPQLLQQAPHKQLPAAVTVGLPTRAANPKRDLDVPTVQSAVLKTTGLYLRPQVQRPSPGRKGEHLFVLLYGEAGVEPLFKNLSIDEVPKPNAVPAPYLAELDLPKLIAWIQAHKKHVKVNYCD